MGNLGSDGRLSSLTRIDGLRGSRIRHLRERTQEETENASHTSSYALEQATMTNREYRQSQA
mgnify:FL=1